MESSRAVGGGGREVRTVGQVTFDETRVHTITLKVDGFVDQLIVNATGQAVTAGQPLLTSYSPMLVTAQEELLLARRLQNDVSAASAETRRSAADMLLSSRGVSEVVSVGGFEKQYQVDIDPAKLLAYGLRSEYHRSGYVTQDGVTAGNAADCNGIVPGVISVFFPTRPSPLNIQATTGTVKEKVLPTFGVLLTESLPPCDSTSPFAMVRPSPTPPRWLRCDCQKRSNR